MNITKVIYNGPATIVFWDDNTKTVVKCDPRDHDRYSEEMGLAMAIVRKAAGNNRDYYDVFKKWASEEPSNVTKWADNKPFFYQDTDSLSNEDIEYTLNSIYGTTDINSMYPSFDGGIVKKRRPVRFHIKKFFVKMVDRISSWYHDFNDAC